MARTRTSSPTYEPTPASRALKLRRTELGKSQADVAFDSEVLTQTTVSELERAKYGPEDLTASRLAALARGLNWTVAELEQATGLNLNLSPAPPASRPLTDAERRGWTLPDEDQGPEIPEALRVAAEKYGHGENAPLAERRWLEELADLDFREEPETPEDWLALYSRLSKMIDPKDRGN